MTTKREISEVLFRLYRLGFDVNEANQLRGIAMTLSRWSEHECNGEIERDESTGKPVRRVEYPRVMLSGPTQWIVKRYPIADREAGALRRLAAILTCHPEMAYYHQGDPRGASLYLYPKARLAEGQDIACWYSAIGTAVY